MDLPSPAHVMNSPGTVRSRVQEYLGLNRNVGVLAASTFLIAMGEELWLAFLPKYLVELGASAVVVGIFGSAKDLLDGVYQYPGGWVADHYGRKRALIGFTVVAAGGYLLGAAAHSWWVMFPALLLIMAWKSGAFPVSFAIIGDSLPSGKRGIAFSVQSIMQRFPRVLGAPIGGALMLAWGIRSGVSTALMASFLLAVVTLFLQKRGFREHAAVHQDSLQPRPRVGLPTTLKRLLVVECVVRMGEAMAASFIILYVIDSLGVSVSSFGFLYALQQGVAIAIYLPAGKLSDLIGRRPLIALTFFCFAVFPFLVYLAHSTLLLVIAFIVGGLKEFGEPARKSYIVDEAPPSERGRAVGKYYTIRNLVIVPGGILGGLMWGISPMWLFSVSLAVGGIGAVAFLLLFPPHFRGEAYNKDQAP